MEPAAPSRQRQTPHSRDGAEGAPGSGGRADGPGTQPPSETPRAVLRFDLARRPDGGGTNGVAVRATANFLPLAAPQLVDIHQYDVTIASIVSDNKSQGDKTGNQDAGREGKPSKQRPLNRGVFAEWQRQEQRAGGVLAARDASDPGAKPFATPRIAWCAFDGVALLFASRNLGLPQGGTRFLVPNVDDGSGERRTFALTLKKTSTILAQPIVEYLQRQARSQVPSQEALTALDLIVRQFAALDPRLAPINRSFFDPATRENVKSSALKMMKGVYGTVRPVAHGGLAVNVDLAHSMFYPDGPILPILKEELNLPNIPVTLNPAQRALVLSKFRNVQIRVNHRGVKKGRYRLSSLSKDDATRTFFDRSDGSKMSVFDYFQDHYGIVLQYRHLPCVEIRNPGGRVTYFPLEVCEIMPNQRFLGRLKDDEQSQQVRAATILPGPRLQKTNEVHGKLGLATSPYLRGFGIDVSSRLMEVEGRRLKAPLVEYRPNDPRDQHTADPGTKGFWNIPHKAKFHVSGTLSNLVIVSLAEPATLGRRNHAEDNVNNLADQLLKQCKEYGMVANAKIPQVDWVNARNVVVGFRDAIQRAGVARRKGALVLVILPTNSKNPAYVEIKKVAETELGVMTQCLKPKWVLGMESGPDPRDSRGPYPPPRRDVAKTDASFFRQVVLKINAKLGGSNVIVQGGLPIVEDAPTMVMGIDATHPPPGSSLISIAGVVASMDRECTVYRSGIAIVPPRNDSIPVLDEMTVDLLGLFRLEANVLPERIIVFRDGVSEGAFDRMVAEEVGLIKEAARFVSGKIQQRYEPKITFIAVQKRHHTRFYFGRENSDHKGNAFPGTVVDRGVVHPERFEYYLISHPGLQGTSRPTKYQVLYDENNLSSDQVQALTYRLCFLYARSQRAVSLPSPVYYAHLVADRARCHLRGNDGSDAGSRTGLGEEPELDPMKDELRASGLWFI